MRFFCQGMTCQYNNKHRIKTLLQFIAFAFYPKGALIACILLSLVFLATLGVIMAEIPRDSDWNMLLFALTTGATASALVSFVVELTVNYRHNKLAWYELHDYYSIVKDYEGRKQMLMHNTPVQRAEKKAHDEFIAAGGVEELDAEDQPKDLIQATWQQIPEIIPVLKKTFEDKKAFLSNNEIIELKKIMVEFNLIRSAVKLLIVLSPVLYNVLNHPDEEILTSIYSENVLADMPEWMRKHVASKTREASEEKLANAILADQFLLTQFVKDYDISQHALDTYHSSFDEEEEEGNDLSEPEEEEYDPSEPEDEEEFKEQCDAQDKILVEESKSFVSRLISQCCYNIAESIDILEQAILKQPYYSMWLEYCRDAKEKPLDDLMSSSAYEREKKRLEKLLEKQKTKNS